MAVNISYSLPFLEINEPPVENWGYTQTKMYKVNFTWTLNSFSFLQQTKHESPIFCGGPNDEVKWCIYLNASNEYMSILLRLISEPYNKSKVLGKFKISIINDQGIKTNKYKTLELREFQLGESQSGTAISLIRKRTLLEEASVLLPDDILTILCEIKFVTDKTNFSGRKSIEGFQIPECRLADDFSRLLDNKKFSDVTLMAGKHEFPAHKAILAARSDVFDAMFEYEMEESKSNIVNITDVHHEVLQEMLCFIYTGKTPKLKEMASDLYAAADKYSLKKLKAMSEEVLFTQLSIETAAETLVLADMHSADQLKEKTMNFIKLHATDIIKTIGWQKLIKVQSPLIADTLEALFQPTK